MKTLAVSWGMPCAVGLAAALTLGAGGHTDAVVASAPPSGAEHRSPDDPAARDRAHAEEAFGRLPLRFEQDGGQTHPSVRFLSRGRGYALFLTPGEVVLSLRGPGPAQPAGAESRERRYGPQAEERLRSVLRMGFVGANPEPELEGADELTGASHYFKGADPARWRRNVPQYGRVVYRSLWAGVDAAFYGTRQGELEGDFIVAPGADPSTIRLGFEGARDIRLDDEGSLVLEVGTGEIVQHRPFIYQETDGERTVVDGSWVLQARNQVGFRVASYDRTRPLVIDPVLAYVAYLGGSGYEDSGVDVVVDAAGNAYVTGYTDSTDFPTAGVPSQPAFGGGFYDAFVAKLSPSSTLMYSTYLGGSGDDQGAGIAVDTAGNAYVTGNTQSTDFPTAGTPSQPANGGLVDAFVVKLGPTSSLLYSTYLGGSGWDFGRAVDVDAAGNAHVVGDTDSMDFPTAGTPSQRAPGGFGDAFVTKLSPTSALVYSTYLGGEGFDWGRDIAVDTAGNAHVVGGTEAEDFPTAGTPFQPANAGGGDAFVTKLSPTSSLLYSTYLGGSGYTDGGDGIAVDSAGDVYVTGITESTDFPTAGPPFQAALAGGVDAFVVRLSLATGLTYSSYLGGSGFDRGQGISVDASGDAHVIGNTQSTDFPTAGGPVQPANGGGQDAFVAKVSPAPALVYSTYLGGSSYDVGEGVATDAAGNAYVVGSTGSTETGDAFVAKFQWASEGPEVNLKVDGVDAVYPDFATLANPVKLTIDMTEGPEELDHYYYWWVGGTTYWFTWAGVSTTPAPLASFPPADLTDYELFNGDVPPGTWIFGWLILDGSSVVHSDFIVTVVTP